MCGLLNLDRPFRSCSCTVCVESICSALTEMVVSQQEAARSLQIMLGANWMALLIQYTCMYVCTMQVLETAISLEETLKLNGEASAFHMQNYICGWDYST